MAGEQSTNPRPSASMPENPLQNRVLQKVIIIKSNPALGVHGVKRKLDFSSGNLEKVQKPSKTPLMPCSSLSAGLVAETTGKNIFLCNNGSKTLICTLPKSSVQQNHSRATVATLSTIPTVPKITLMHKNSQLIKTVKEAVVSKTLSKDALPRQFCTDGGIDPGCAKLIGQGFFIIPVKKFDGISSNGLKPVAFTLGQLIYTPQIQASNSSPASYQFPLKDTSKNDLLFSQSAQNAGSTLMTAVPVTSEGSATCQDPRRSSELITDLSDVGVNDMIPQIQCPFRSSGCEFQTSNVGHLTDHVDWHMAAVPLQWRVSCHKCSAVFDNFLDVMVHLSQKTCSSMTVKVCAFSNDPATQVGRCESIENCFSKPLVDAVSVNALNCHSVSSDVLAQKYVDSLRSPEVDSPRKPVNCQNVLSIEQMGLFLAVQPSVRSNIFSSKWSVIRNDNPSSLAECLWQRPLPQVQLKKSVALSSNPAFKISSVVSSQTGVLEDTQALRNASETDQAMAKCSETSSKLQTLTVPSHVFNQLLGTKSESSNVQQVKLLVNVNNNLQSQLQNVVQKDETVAANSKCVSKLRAQMLNKSLPLKNKKIRVEPFRPKAMPIIDTSRNLNRSAYAEIETIYIGQQYGTTENVKVIIKQIDTDLQYQCPYCIYNSQSIFDVANHLVQEHDNADLELNNTNSIHLKTHTLLMHCRLCDYVTHHHASLLWHLQDIHSILDEPLMLTDDRVKTSEIVALESKQTLHFRCARFDKCAFASISVSAVAQHSYQAHASNSKMFGIGHVRCHKVSYRVCHGDSSDIRITPQFVCARCHVITLSRKLFSSHYLYKHANRLLYICMYCEAHLNSLAAITNHIDFRHAGFKRLICSVMFVGDLGEAETAIIQCEQSPNVFIDTEAPASGMVVRHHGLASVHSVPCTDVKIASSNATRSSEVHQSTSFLTNSYPADSLNAEADAGSDDSTFYANVIKIEDSETCSVTYKGCEVRLPYSIVAPLLKRP